MSAPAYRLTEAAHADVTNILKESASRFGPMQRDRYAALLERAAMMVAETPERPGSRDRRDLVAGVRSFHLEHAAGRRGAASHILYYIAASFDDGPPGVVIVRILHERMEAARHLNDAPEP